MICFLFVKIIISLQVPLGTCEGIPHNSCIHMYPPIYVYFVVQKPAMGWSVVRIRSAWCEMELRNASVLPTVQHSDFRRERPIIEVQCVGQMDDPTSQPADFSNALAAAKSILPLPTMGIANVRWFHYNEFTGTRSHSFSSLRISKQYALI